METCEVEFISSFVDGFVDGETDQHRALPRKGLRTWFDSRAEIRANNTLYCLIIF